MSLAASDAALKAAPTLVCGEEIFVTNKKKKTANQNSKERVDFYSCLLDFIKLELCADQSVGELVCLSLLLAADET